MTAHPKREVSRPYPPEFVSAETLAYLLDYSRSAVDQYVQKGLLPQPEIVGTHPRWYWPDVVAFIKARNRLATEPEGGHPAEEDVYLRGIKRGASSHA